MMLRVGTIIPVLGANKISFAGALVFAAGLGAIPHMPDAISLGAIVLIAGAAFGALDVAMNTEAAALESRLAKSSMSSFHALFSVGNLAGAGICGMLLRQDYNIASCLGTAGICVGALVVFAYRRSPSDPQSFQARKVGSSTRTSYNSAENRRLLLLGGIAFLALFAEGALCDWIAIYLVDILHTTESTAAFGFATFAGAMALGRSIGDYCNNRLGSIRVFRGGALIVAVSVSCTLSTGNLALVFLALFFAGLGISNLVPRIFSSAGRSQSIPSSVAMSRVATMGYAGLLLGPPFIGFIAQSTSLVTSFVFIAVAMITVASGSRLTDWSKQI
ncbi:hypothetical protein CU100_17190 [Phyllobacterium endophyticum]|uniref:MFS transporter n=2 Tax=Phyllobacterium endophyticum TaxID=1149773 RepID=A0A2P7AS15_9HYPH|nr:hypothetical protein CU100_17190 [Phyllobacterium endophyticum]